MEYIEAIRPFFLVIYYIFVSFVVFVIILDNKKPEKSFAFIFLILLFPVAGLLIYLLFGARYQKKRLFTRKRYFDRVYLNKIGQGKGQSSELHILESYTKLPTLFYNMEQVNFSLNNEVRMLCNGEEKFPVLKEEILKAKKSIHLDYYIFNDDTIGTEILELLCQKSREGVKVRVTG